MTHFEPGPFAVGPAERPPSSFDGTQYVDSEGCAFIRAGISGSPMWVPRLSRDRERLDRARALPRGDAQQLDQVIQGTHPGGSEASVLKHLLGEHATVPPDRGLFLERTFRLHPDICAYTSELFYGGRLHPRPGLEVHPDRPPVQVRPVHAVLLREPRLEQHDVFREIRLQFGVGHGVAAVLDDDGAVVELADVGQGLDEDLCLLGGRELGGHLGGDEGGCGGGATQLWGKTPRGRW